MSFLAIDAQKCLFMLQRNQLQFEQTLVMSDANAIARQIEEYAQAKGDGYDLESDSEYIALQEAEEQLETEQDSLDTQIQLLDTEINNLKSMVQNNIKNNCSLNLVGG